MSIPIVTMKTFATAQVAKLVGVSKRTLLRWLYRGVLKEPKKSKMPGSEWRMWTAVDIQRAKALKAKMKPGRKSGKQYSRVKRPTRK